jgi:hypothetical protein
MGSGGGGCGDASRRYPFFTSRRYPFLNLGATYFLHRGATHFYIAALPIFYIAALPIFTSRRYPFLHRGATHFYIAMLQYFHITALPFLPFILRRWRMKIGMLVGYPFYKISDRIVRQQCFNGVIFLKQFAFGKYAVNFAVADAVHRNGNPASEGFRNQVMYIPVGA